MAVPAVKLNSGNKMPILGFGTWNAPKGVVGEAVQTALKVGYRHLDCAWVYQNEKEIGDALQTVYKEGNLSRKDIFMTSKLWNTFHDPQDVKESLKETLRFLQTDYLDLYLMHWPFSFFKKGDIIPKDENEKCMFTDVHYVDTWKAMEECQKEGLVKAIGVSNFNEFQIKKIIEKCSIPPAVHQIECHPYLNEEDHIRGTADEPVVLEDKVLKEVAAKYGKTVAQIAIKFQVQRGVIVIPKSVKPERIESNFKVFDFELAPEDMDAIRGVNRNWRGLSFDFVAKEHKYWAFRPNYSEE